MSRKVKNRISAASAAFMMVSISMMTLLTLMPMNVAAAGNVTGTITELGTGTPIQGAQVFVFQDISGPYTRTQADGNGDYDLPLGAAGNYTILIMENDYNGSMATFTHDGTSTVNMDFTMMADLIAPELTDVSLSTTEAISPNNPVTIDMTVTEDWLLFASLNMYMVVDVNGEMTTGAEVRSYPVNGFLQYPGLAYEQVSLVEDAPGVNSTSCTFNGTTTMATVGDGTDVWTLPYQLKDDRAVLAGYYQNTTIGPNTNMAVMTFNMTNGILEDITLIDMSTLAMSTVDLSDVTGVVRFQTREITFNMTEMSAVSSENVNVTTLISISNLQPITFSTDLPSGDYILMAVADDFGSHSNTTVRTFTVDMDLPVAEAGANMTVKQGVELMLNGSASTDNMGIVNYTWTFNDTVEEVTVYDWNGTYTFPEIGLIEVTLSITDMGGWTAMDTTFVNVTDGIAPLADAGENITAMQDEEFMFNGNMSTDNYDAWEDMAYAWSFNDTVQNVTVTGWNATYTLAEIGLYEVTLVVTDNGGNPSDPATVWVDITDGHSPVAEAGTDITTKQFEEVTFNSTASTDNVGIVNYTWTFMENAIDQTLYGAQPKYIFTHMGEVNVTLTVLDGAGMSASDVVTVTVLDGDPPVAEAGLNITGEVNETLSFNASASTDNIGIVTYTWDFGDNTTAVGMLATHVYTAVGTYTVTLTCADAEGNEGSDTLTVTVDPENHPPVILAIAKQTATAGQAFTFTVPVSDEDVTDILIFELLEAPTGMFINAGTGVISWTPGTNLAGQTFDVKVEVSDGKAKVNSTFQVQVIYADLVLTVGPIKDKDGEAVKKVEVTVYFGVERYEGETDANGLATMTVPGALVGQVVTVKLSKDGYKDATFSGTVNADGTLAPTDGHYPKLELKEEGQDYTFLVIVIIVLVVLALVLLSMRKPIEEEEDIEDEDEEKKGSEEE